MDRDARDPSLDEVRQELRQDIHASAAETRQYVDAVAAGLRQQIEASAVETRSHVDAVAAETRRHFDVVAEGMLSKVQLVAEGLGALGEKVERFREEVHEDFRKVDRRLLRLEAERL